eukprot:Anaeramoba_ignava/c16888_g1_i1.p10 GENE.c16888_g1_i1~~c16888_g1_i1.p10  ORF type:complete len:121 (-),score=14.76 c16888_g1_i1:7595-7957(-)
MSGNLSELDQINETDIIDVFKNEELVSGEENSPVEDITNIPEGLLDEAEETESIEEVSSGEEIADPGEIEILPLQEIESALEEQEEEKISLSASSLSDLTDILSKLLNNKTIEITIKIKD